MPQLLVIMAFSRMGGKIYLIEKTRSEIKSSISCQITKGVLQNSQIKRRFIAEGREWHKSREYELGKFPVCTWKIMVHGWGELRDNSIN